MLPQGNEMKLKMTETDLATWQKDGSKQKLNSNIESKVTFLSHPRWWSDIYTQQLLGASEDRMPGM